MSTVGSNDMPTLLDTCLLYTSAAEHHVVADKSDKPTRTLWGDAFKRLRKNKLAMFAVVWLTIDVYKRQTLCRATARLSWPWPPSTA